MHCLLSLLVHQILLFVGLDCDDVPRLLVSGSTYNSEGALAYLQVDLEFFEFQWL